MMIYKIILLYGSVFRRTISGVLYLNGSPKAPAKYTEQELLGPFYAHLTKNILECLLYGSSVLGLEVEMENKRLTA